MNDHLFIYLSQRVDGTSMNGFTTTPQKINSRRKIVPRWDLTKRSISYRRMITGQTLTAIVVLSVFTSTANAQDQVPADRQRTNAAQQPQMDRSGFPTLVAPQASDVDAEQADDGGPFSGPLVTTISSLVIVLSIFAGLVWISRHYGGGNAPSGALPKDVLQNLGSSALDSKTKVTFLKCGNRILVVGQVQNGDPQTLTEITDADEVERITNRCMGRPEIIGRRSESGTQHSRIDYAAG